MNKTIVSKEVQPKNKWSSLEEYVLYLKQFAAYKYASKFIDKKKVLEVGCGSGYGANYLSKYCNQYIGIDMSEQNIYYCKETYKKDNLRFIIANSTDLPYDSKYFDVVLSFQVIEHINPEKVINYLSEIRRVMKDDSIFICSTPNKNIRLLPFQKPWNPEHKREYNFKEFDRLMKMNFEYVKINFVIGSDEINSIEINRVKKYALRVYLTKPLLELFPFFKKIKKSKIKKHTPFNNYAKRYSVDDFKIISTYKKNCLDLLGLCKIFSKK